MSYDEPRFKTPCSIIVAGPSQWGKTTFVRSLLQHSSWVFDRPPVSTVYCYGEPQACFETMQQQGVQFHHGVPEDIRSLFPPARRPGLLILDDLMRDCGQDQRVLDLFTRGSHHNDVTCIYLTQNLFPAGKYARTISLNSHYVIVFKNPRDAVGVRNLAQQAYPGSVPYIMDLFRDTTAQPYGYLLFDLHPTTPDALRLRTNVLASPTVVYSQQED